VWDTRSSVGKTFATQMFGLQVRIVRELNNAHIFLEEANPRLVKGRERFAKSSSKAEKRYSVPASERRKFAKRTDARVKEIYDSYLTTGLFEAFLVSTLSRFESFLADVLMAFFIEFPMRLTQRVQGIPACPEMSASDIVNANDKDELMRMLIREHMEQVFRQRPSEYMKYVVEIIGVQDDKSFLDYYELAATRDLVVHNGGVINGIYLRKAGRKARGELAKRLAVNKKYFYGALATMKKVSGAIKRDVERKYQLKKKE
jgi:hypothetical protein